MCSRVCQRCTRWETSILHQEMLWQNKQIPFLVALIDPQVNFLSKFSCIGVKQPGFVDFLPEMCDSTEPIKRIKPLPGDFLLIPAGSHIILFKLCNLEQVFWNWVFAVQLESGLRWLRGFPCKHHLGCLSLHLFRLGKCYTHFTLLQIFFFFFFLEVVFKIPLICWEWVDCRADLVCLLQEVRLSDGTKQSASRFP